MISDVENKEETSEEWLPICDNRGCMYFYNKSSGEVQRTYPKRYSKKHQKYINIFYEDWERITKAEKTYYKNKKTKITQLVSPSSTLDLFESAFTGNIAFIQLYLSFNGDINLIDKKSRNALHFAVMNDHHEIVKILLNFNINLNQKDYLLQTPAFYSVFYHSYKSLDYLIENKADLNIQDSLGDTLLHQAVRNNNKQLIYLLVLNGADLRIKNKKNIYPVDIASQNYDMKLVEYLMKLTNYINYKNQNNENNKEKVTRKLVANKLEDEIQKIISNNDNLAINENKLNEIQLKSKRTNNDNSYVFENKNSKRTGTQNNNSIISQISKRTGQKSNIVQFQEFQDEISKKEKNKVFENQIESNPEIVPAPAKRKKKKKYYFLTNTFKHVKQDLSKLGKELSPYMESFKEKLKIVLQYAFEKSITFSKQVKELMVKFYYFSKEKAIILKNKTIYNVKKAYFNYQNRPDIENQIKFDENDIEINIFEPERLSNRGRLYTLNRSLNLSKSIKFTKNMNNSSLNKSQILQEIKNLTNQNEKSRLNCFQFYKNSRMSKKKIINKSKKIVSKINSLNLNLHKKKGGFIKQEIEINNENISSRNSLKFNLKKFLRFRQIIGLRKYNLITNSKKKYFIIDNIFKLYSSIKDNLIKTTFLNYPTVSKKKLRKIEILVKLNEIKNQVNQQYIDIIRGSDEDLSLIFKYNNFFEQGIKSNLRYGTNHLKVSTIENVSIIEFPKIISKASSEDNEIMNNFSRNHTQIFQLQATANISIIKNQKAIYRLENINNLEILSNNSKTMRIEFDDYEKGIVENTNFQLDNNRGTDKPLIYSNNPDNKNVQNKARNRNNSRYDLDGEHIDEFKKKKSNECEIEIKPQNSNILTKYEQEQIIERISKIEENWDKFPEIIVKKESTTSLININESLKKNEKSFEDNDIKEMQNEEEDEVDDNSETSLGLGLINILNNFNQDLKNRQSFSENKQSYLSESNQYRTFHGNVKDIGLSSEDLDKKNVFISYQKP